MALAVTASEETDDLPTLQAQLMKELHIREQENVELFRNAYIKYVMSLKPATLNDANYVKLFRHVVTHFKRPSSQNQHLAGPPVPAPAAADPTSDSITQSPDSIK